MGKKRVRVVHETRDGRSIPLHKLEDDHLLNILRWHHRRAEEGIIVGSFFGGEVLYADMLCGEEVLDRFRHELYVCEAVERGLTVPCGCRCEKEEG